MEKQSRLRQYHALISQASALNLPKHYQTDLTVHDQEWCMNTAPANASFLWAIYDCGTHVALPGTPEARALYQAHYEHGYFAKDWHAYLLNQAGQLQPLDAEDFHRLAYN